MKIRYVACSFALIAVVAAWMLRPASPAAADSTPAPTTKLAANLSPATLAAVTTPAAKPAMAPQVVAPKIAPAPVSKPVAPAAVVDAQKDLSTALPDLAKLVQSGDLVTAWQTYAQPDHFAEIPLERRAQVDDHLRALATNPQGQMRVQILSQVLDSFGSQTPTLNEAGDLATYQVSGPAASIGAKAIRFQKVDGRWYIANDDLDNIGRLLGL